MRKLILCFFCLMTAPALAGGKLVINEIACGAQNDWVEIKYIDDKESSIDISGLFVTMYYGSNGSVSEKPVTLYSYDRPETPYDDRFAVIYPCGTPEKSENDFTGDSDRNGRIDVHCSNYYAGFWNSDCVIAIDTDDDPSNGGIIDFAAFSNRDGSPNSTISSYALAASQHGHWDMAHIAEFQDKAAYTGAKGLGAHQSLSRIKSGDSDSMADFAVTEYQTPGRDNMMSPEHNRKGLFKILTKSLIIIPQKDEGPVPISLFLFESASLKLRIFSITGRTVYISPFYKKISPGFYSIHCGRSVFRGLPTGLYPVKIEASGTKGKCQSGEMYVIINRYGR